MLSKNKKIILIIILCLLAVSVFYFFRYYSDKQELEKQFEIQRKAEIKKVQTLVHKAQETAEKEPLITISENGFSEEEIKIKANSFMSFYNSGNSDIILKSEYFKSPKTIRAGTTVSLKFKQSAEVKIKDSNQMFKIITE